MLGNWCTFVVLTCTRNRFCAKSQMYSIERVREYPTVYAAHFAACILDFVLFLRKPLRQSYALTECDTIFQDPIRLVQYYSQCMGSLHCTSTILKHTDFVFRSRKGSEKMGQPFCGHVFIIAAKVHEHRKRTSFDLFCLCYNDWLVCLSSGE